MIRKTSLLDRRTLLAGLTGSAALLCIPRSHAVGTSQAGTPFSGRIVTEEARRLASRPFQPLPLVPKPLQSLAYDRYRQIRFRKNKAVWGEAPTQFSVELFAPGFLYTSGVEIFIVESGQSRAIDIQPDSFETPSPEIAALLNQVGKFAGFRLHNPINGNDYRDEFVVFQGASYFRAVSTGQTYGLSARGLAIDVAEPTGEEFPVFRRFWIERPSSRVNSIVVHALLDSKRVAGAYRFGIFPGHPTRIDVDATLFARTALPHVGLGALTSMFFHGDTDPPAQPDYRTAVHDSSGLAMLTGRGERLWRPLNNPEKLQVSSFVDAAPKGFGLIQRNRRFEQFQDMEASYESRPSAWIEPRGDWGRGHVQLIEIPSNAETNDNIVAYWRPERPLEPNVAFKHAYRLTWSDDVPSTNALAPVIRSAAGRTLDGSHRQMVVDYFVRPSPKPEDIKIDVALSVGRLVEQVPHIDPVGGRLRVFVTFDPGRADVVEFRLLPLVRGKPIGETWLYRWTRR